MTRFLLIVLVLVLGFASEASAFGHGRRVRTSCYYPTSYYHSYCEPVVYEAPVYCAPPVVYETPVIYSRPVVRLEPVLVQPAFVPFAYRSHCVFGF